MQAKALRLLELTHHAWGLGDDLPKKSRKRRPAHRARNSAAAAPAARAVFTVDRPGYAEARLLNGDLQSL